MKNKVEYTDKSNGAAETEIVTVSVWSAGGRKSGGPLSIHTIKVAKGLTEEEILDLADAYDELLEFEHFFDVNRLNSMEEGVKKHYQGKASVYLEIYHAATEGECSVNTQTDVIEEDDSRERWKIARDLYAKWIAERGSDDRWFNQEHCEIKLIRQRQYKTQVNARKLHSDRDLVWKSTIGELKTLKDETKEEAKIRIDQAYGMISEATDYEWFIYKSPSGYPLATMELSFSRVKGKYIPRFGQPVWAQSEWNKTNSLA